MLPQRQSVDPEQSPVSPNASIPAFNGQKSGGCSDDGKLPSNGKPSVNARLRQSVWDEKSIRHVPWYRKTAENSGPG
jgi:hypothetical protein